MFFLFVIAVFLAFVCIAFLAVSIHQSIEENDALEADIHNQEYRAKYYPYHY